jgi:hypothetical protein
LGDEAKNQYRLHSRKNTVGKLLKDSSRRFFFFYSGNCPIPMVISKFSLIFTRPCEKSDSLAFGELIIIVRGVQ